jgi:hypothetical protein
MKRTPPPRVSDAEAIDTLVKRLNSDASALRTIRKAPEFARFSEDEMARLKAAIERYEAARSVCRERYDGVGCIAAEYEVERTQSPIPKRLK